MQDFHGQMNVLKGEIERWKKGHYSIVFLGSDEERVKKLERVLLDYDIEAIDYEWTTFTKWKSANCKRRLTFGL